MSTNNNPFGRPSDRLRPPTAAGNGINWEEYKGPLACPRCGGGRFKVEPEMELFHHVFDNNRQLQKHFNEIACASCGTRVNLAGEEVPPPGKIVH